MTTVLHLSDAPDQVANAFRLAMRVTGQTVCVVACRDPASGARFGLTASSVTSVSLTPPGLLVCINREASMAPCLAIGLPISITVLADDQADISNAFATVPETASRFEHGEWVDALDNTEASVPCLEGGAAQMLATIRQIADWGSHRIVIASVEAAVSDPSRQPLLYHDGGYYRLGTEVALAE